MQTNDYSGHICWAIGLVIFLLLVYSAWPRKVKPRPAPEPEPPPDPHADCVDHVTYCVHRKKE